MKYKTIWIYVVILLGFFGSRFCDAEEFPAGILFYSPSNLGDKFAIPIQFRKLETFSVSVKTTDLKGVETDIQNRSVSKILYLKAPLGNLSSDGEIAQLDKEFKELTKALERFPKGKDSVQLLVDKYSAAKQMISNGYVRYQSRWISKDNLASMIEEMEKSRNAGTFDFSDLGGREYKNAKISKVEWDGIVFTHSNGVGRLAFDKLNFEMQRKYSALAPKKPEVPDVPLAAKEHQGEVFEKSEKDFSSFFQKEVDWKWTPNNLDEVADCVVLIEGDSGSGSGFVVSVDGQAFIYTNAHVISGNKNMKVIDRNGQIFSDMVSFEAAGAGFADGDVVRMKLKNKRKKYLQFADQTEQQLKNGAPIAALGNSHGMAVVRILKGEIDGFGPERVEISAEIVQGNSGGPIVDAKTLKVIGISTMGQIGRKDIWSKDTEFEKVRRFGLRPLQVESWKAVPVSNFVAEEAVVKQMRANVLLVGLMDLLEVKVTGVYYDEKLSVKGEYLVEDILSEYDDHVIVQNIFKLNDLLKNTGTRNRGREAVATYARFIAATGRGMVKLRESQNFSEWSFYNRAKIEELDLIHEHRLIEKNLEQILVNLKKVL